MPTALRGHASDLQLSPQRIKAKVLRMPTQSPHKAVGMARERIDRGHTFAMPLRSPSGFRWARAGKNLMSVTSLPVSLYDI
jgi:hypothetical protein